MLEDLKNTIKHSAVYGLSRVASKALSFVFIPLYTSVYSAGVIGDINLFETFWQYLFTLCLFGFETTIITHCSNLNEDSRKKLLFNFLTLLVLNCFVFLVLGLLFSHNFSQLYFKNDNYSTVIFYSFLVCIFESLLALPLCIARLKQKPGLYSIIALSSLFISFFLQIYFVYFQKKDFDFIFLAKFLAPMIVFIFCIPVVIDNIKINFNKESVKDIVNFSFFWTIYAILSMALNTLDRFILPFFVSKDLVGVYTLGYGIGSLTNFLVVMPFSLAFSGIFYKKVNEENSARYFTKMSTYLFFTMVFVSLVASLVMPEAIKMFVRNPKLWESINTIRIILFANCIFAIFQSFSFAFLYRKEAKVIVWVTFFTLICNVAGNFIFIRYYGIYAAAGLSVISYIIFVVVLYQKSKKYYFIKLEVYKLVLLSCLYIGLVYLSTLIKQNNLLLDAGINLALIIIFFLLLYIGKFFESSEIYAVKGALNKYLKINLFPKN